MGSTTETVPIGVTLEDGDTSGKTSRVPLQLTGALDTFDSFDVTPIIGKEFPTANLKDWLEAPNSNELIRDLAITSG